MKHYLQEKFGEQVIGYGGFMVWPLRLNDMTTVDFLGGNLGYVADPP